MDVSNLGGPHALLFAVLFYLGSAAVSTMPPKDVEWNARTFYAWFYDWIHLVINSRNQLPTLPALK